MNNYYFMGEPYEDWAALKQFYHKKGFSSSKEFLACLDESEEYKAIIALLESKLKRIQKLAALEIKDLENG